VPKPTDIVLISDFAWISGGSSTVAIRSAQGLARRGYRVRFFASVGPVDPELVEAGVEVDCLDQPIVGHDPSRLRAIFRGLWSRKAAARLRALLASCPADRTVVHFHQWQNALSPSPFGAVQRSGLPFTITFHDYSVVCPNHAFYVYPKNEICHRAPLSAACLACNCDPGGYSRKLWHFAQSTLQNAWGGVPRKLKHGIYLSDLNQRVLKPYLPDDIAWHHVTNPIDAEKAPRVDAAANKAFYFVARLAAYKGALDFAKATRSAGVPAVIVGDGELREAVEAANPDIEITGWLPADQLNGRLGAARALVFPSTWYEGHPLIVPQAKSLGVPAIVGDACAAADFIEHGENGLIHKSGDADDLAQKIEMLRDNGLVDRLSRAVYDEFWGAPPLLDAHLDELEEVYAKMLI